jgi:4-amino-4-deoxy-L-arabinose transferase-like glycosyltransferase
VRAWRDGQPGANGFSWQRFALVWATFVFLFFSASGSKLPSYVLPLFPVLSLVAAWLLHDMPPRTLARLAWPLVGLAGALLVAVAVAYEPLVRRIVPDTETLAPALAFYPWVIAAFALGTGGGAAALVALRRADDRSRTVAVLAIAASMLATVQVGMLGYDEFRTIRSARDMLRAAAAQQGPLAVDVPFYHVHMYDQTTPFYLRRTTTFVGFRDEFALGQDAEPGKAFDQDSEWLPVWKSLPQGYAMMPTSTYDEFVADGVPMTVLARDGRRVLVSRR